MSNRNGLHLDASGGLAGLAENIKFLRFENQVKFSHL